jgi:hypothetical protein
MATIKDTSRYKGAIVTTENEAQYILLKKLIQVPLTTEDFYITLDQGNALRPDIISNQVYGTVDYGWAIMEVNNIRNFLELEVGVRLRIPPLSAIEEAQKTSVKLE